MFYKKYKLYDEKIEIMLPADLNESKVFFNNQHSWISEDRRRAINISRGGGSLCEEQVLFKLDEYYQSFERDILRFDCVDIKKHIINFHTFGDIRYWSDMMGYRFYNIFMLGCFEERELIITLQCMKEEQKTMKHVFDNIIDSMRIRDITVKENSV